MVLVNLAAENGTQVRKKNDKGNIDLKIIEFLKCSIRAGIHLRASCSARCYLESRVLTSTVVPGGVWISWGSWS